MWNNLSMSERSELMKLYLKNGITSLSAMKENYNSYATGGALPDYDPEHLHYHDSKGNKILTQFTYTYKPLIKE